MMIVKPRLFLLTVVLFAACGRDRGDRPLLGFPKQSTPTPEEAAPHVPDPDEPALGEEAAGGHSLGGQPNPPTPPPSVPEAPGALPFVLHVSVDGLRPDAIEVLGPEMVPAFYRMQAEGAYTHDARTDADYTVTLPNHASQITGRPVLGPTGHSWTGNSFATGASLHENRGSYVASVFDVAHDHGLRTALFSGKSKFQIFADSYGEDYGAVDSTGEDNGRAKIDRVFIDASQTAEVDALISDLEGAPHRYTFLHFADADLTGHSLGWDLDVGSPYLSAVRNVDADLGRIFAAIDASHLMAEHTTVFLTSDHGGTDSGHSVASVLTNFRIPFYAWGRGVAAGRDLYELNNGRRQHPGDSQVPFDSSMPPIRNIDAANAACRQLGLPTIPGSSVNVDNDKALLLEESD